MYCIWRVETKDRHFIKVARKSLALQELCASGELGNCQILEPGSELRPAMASWFHPQQVVGCVFFNYVHLCLSVSIIFYLFLSIYLYLLVSVSLSISLYFNIYGQGKMQRKSPSLSHKPPNTEVAPKVHRDPLRLLDLDPRFKSCHGCAKPAQAEIQRGGSAYLAWWWIGCKTPPPMVDWWLL
jgi:hypothetical protein